jgi:predicted nucleic acid-binding protein
MSFMLDTNIFNAVLDGRVSIASIAHHRLLTTGVQAGELRATKDPSRRAGLLGISKQVNVSSLPTSTFAFDIDGAGAGEAHWNDGSGRFEKMLARLNEFERKKDELNPQRDILIAETALKNGAILVSDDRRLRKVFAEFGGNALSLDEFLKMDPPTSLWHPFTRSEADASQVALDVLRGETWAAPLVADIEHAGGVAPSNMTLLFEARFGLALHDRGIQPVYEQRAGVGESSVDFAFGPWLVELLSLGETDAAQDASWQQGPFFGRMLQSPTPPGDRVTDPVERKRLIAEMKQSTEGEILKVVDRLVDKATTKDKRGPHKFPAPTDRVFSMLVADIRAPATGNLDETDLRQIAFGPAGVFPDDVLEWVGEDGKVWPIRGVFDAGNSLKGSRFFRERVHFLGLVCEKTYARDEMQHVIRFFHNPNLLTPERAAEVLGRFPLYNPGLDRDQRPERYLDEHFKLVSSSIVQHAIVIDGKPLVYKAHKDLLEDLAGRAISSEEDLKQTFWQQQDKLVLIAEAKFYEVGADSDGTISIYPRDRQ